MNDTTRKHPRTLSEAFPHDPSYAAGLELPKRARLRLTGYEWGVIFALACAVVGLCFAGMSW